MRKAFEGVHVGEIKRNKTSTKYIFDGYICQREKERERERVSEVYMLSMYICQWERNIIIVYVGWVYKLVEEKIR